MVRVTAVAVALLPAALSSSLRTANDNLVNNAKDDISQSLLTELGCYTDTRDRVFSNRLTDNSLTPASCASHCSDFPYYGLQYANECWCGEFDTNYALYGTSSGCDIPCAGDSSENCGGSYAMRIVMTAEADPDSLACVRDARDRIFSNQLTSSDMSPSVCNSHCGALGKFYYGTQWGEECWCGEESTDYSALGDATCDRPCSGDPTKICGGGFAMNVYEVESGDTTPTPTSVYDCYADDTSERVGWNMLTDEGDMTHEICIDYCDGFNAAWAMPQYGRECFCGYVDTDIDQYGLATCNIPCEGDESQICGGSRAFNAIPLSGTATSPGVTPTPVPGPSITPVPTPAPVSPPMVSQPVSAPTTVMTIPTSCTDSLPEMRWAEGSGSHGRLYMEGEGCATMTDLYNFRLTTSAGVSTPKGPIYVLDDDGKVDETLAPNGKWLITSELYVREGAIFYCRGTGSKDGDGDCDELRIQSIDGDDYQHIRGHGGSLYFENTLVTSWDTNNARPNEDYTVGRAYLNCVSEYESEETCEGQPQNDFGECRMDIINSEMGYMGWMDSESYGLTWKVRGFCKDKSNPEVFDYTNVYGDILGSDIHHMYYGMYSYGHMGGVWTNNKMHDNHQYGFDPHDDSDYLTIANNEVYDNVNHGIIASKRCNNVKIYNNIVRDGGADAVGIFLHRSSDSCEIYDNTITNMQDAGIALLESFDADIHDNVIEGGEYGIRISLGGGNNKVYKNTFDSITKYGLYTYRGSDEPDVSEDGRPTQNEFYDNVISNTEVGVKLKRSDDNIIRDNDFTDTESLEFNDAQATSFYGNSLPSGACYSNISGTDEDGGPIPSSTFASNSDLPELC